LDGHAGKQLPPVKSGGVKKRGSWENVKKTTGRIDTRYPLPAKSPRWRGHGTWGPSFQGILKGKKCAEEVKKNLFSQTKEDS